MNNHGPSSAGGMGYVAAAIIMTVVAICAVVGIEVLLPPDRASDAVSKVIVLVTPTLAAILALVKLQDVHRNVNGVVSQLTDMTAKAAYSEGVMTGAQARRASDPPLPKQIPILNPAGNTIGEAEIPPTANLGPQSPRPG